MPISDQPAPGSGIPDATAVSEQIKRMFRKMVVGVDKDMARIRGLVSIHGRSAINTALPPGEGAEMLTLYNNLKTVLESAEVGFTLEDLP